jgi:ribonuclease P protein component
VVFFLSYAYSTEEYGVLCLGMKKKYRIKKNEEFQQVFQDGQSMANRQFVIYVLDRPEQPYFRLGLSVSKKIGKAVVRNRVKRYIRQAFLELREEIVTGKDYVIIARMPASEMNYFEVKKSLMHVLKKAGMLKRNI